MNHRRLDGQLIRRRCTGRSRRSRAGNTQGFTLIELMLAVSIVGILASLAIPNYIDFLEKARVARAVSELHALAKEIKGFAIGGGGYPDTLAQIGRSTMLDPWGTPYQYYRINCTTDVEITNLARLKLRKNRPPRVLLADHSLRTSDGWHVSFAVDHGEHQDLLHLVAGGGGA
ncbi:MAG: prepilin-type N-terminal cleavage/methylation domain-containing protein, partial [Nitrospira sp.]|nr:prepilin-type N-terminal cleavage/methylation domain-containing protein [Nitrospira sp.]